MYTVSQLAGIANVTPDAVRHYVHIGILTPERDPDNGYKLFTNEDLNTLKFVKQAKSLGFTLADINKILDVSGGDDSQKKLVKEIIRHRIKENKEKLETLSKLQERMVMALEQWSGEQGGNLDQDSICYLIESVNI